MMRLVLILSTMVFIASGCASNTKSECQKQDWLEVGVSDGQKGKAVDEIMKEYNKCNKAAVEIPLDKYKEGWTTGIAEYCSVDNAKKLGRERKTVDAAVCPIEYRPAFENAYLEGKKLSKVNKEISALNNEKEDLKEEIASKENKLDKINSKKEKLQSDKQNLVK